MKWTLFNKKNYLLFWHTINLFCFKTKKRFKNKFFRFSYLPKKLSQKMTDSRILKLLEFYENLRKFLFSEGKPMN